MDDAEKLEKIVPQTDLGMKYVLSIIEHVKDFDEIERIGAYLLGYVEFIRSYKEAAK